jgi:transposase
MLHAGLDVSRKRLDVGLFLGHAGVVEGFAAPPDADGLGGVARRVGAHGMPVRAVIESMTGARLVHDTLEELGWDVLIADAAKVKGLAPLACKTDKIDARVVVVLLSHRDLVPRSGCPIGACVVSEQGRFRMHLVGHRSMLKHRIHATLISFGHPCPVSDRFGVAGRELLDRLDVPQPWRGTVDASLALIDDLDRRVDAINRELRAGGADHPYVPLLLTVPGIGWVLTFTIAAEIGDIRRLASPKKLCGYTGLCPRVYQSGDRDSRGPLTKQGPKYPRWAMLEAPMHALRHPAYRERDQRNKRRPGRQRGAKAAQIDVARKLTEAIWHMLTNHQPFAPAPGDPTFRLAAQPPVWTQAPGTGLQCRLVLPPGRPYTDERRSPTTTTSKPHPDTPTTIDVMKERASERPGCPGRYVTGRTLKPPDRGEAHT